MPDFLDSVVFKIFLDNSYVELKVLLADNVSTYQQFNDIITTYLLRFCTVKYDDSAREMDNLFVHLTNVAIQELNTINILLFMLFIHVVLLLGSLLQW